MTDHLAAFSTHFIPLCLIGLAQVPLRAGQGLDLSGPGVVSASAAAGIWAYGAGSASVPAATLMILATGLVAGLVHGIVVTRGHLPPWFVTLLGFAAGTSLGPGPWSHPPVPSDLAALSTPIAGWYILTALIGIAISLVQEKFIFGRWLLAAGHDEETARLAGVPVAALKTATYGLSGLGAAAASCFCMGHPAPSLWPSPTSLLVDILGVTMIASAVPWKSHGRIAGVALAAAGIATLSLSLRVLGLQNFLITPFKAVLILGVAACFPPFLAGLTTNGRRGD